MAKLQVMTGSARMARQMRNPSHDFVARNRPYSIRPFFLAPVLAGETLKSAQLQMNISSANLRTANTGWWSELYFFYVKHRDLAQRDILSEMHVTNTLDESILDGPNALWYHTLGINWAKLCTIRCVEEYFRDENEPWDVATDVDGFPVAKVGKDNWLDSAQRDGAEPPVENDYLPDEALENDIYQANGVPTGFEAHYDTWAKMTRNRLIAVTFEDYLKSHGISVKAEVEKPHRPELLRYIQDWQIPRATGYVNDPSHTVGRIGWKHTERLDKDRFFKEPGFIIGLWVQRPKIYIAQSGSATGMMSDAFTWLPAMMQDNPETSLREIDAASAGQLFPNYQVEDPINPGDFADPDQGAWFDVRDLLMYGEQHFGGFTDMVSALDLVNGLNLPDVEFMRRYASRDDVDRMWFDESTWSQTPDNTVAVPRHFFAEGVVRLQIASRITDTTGRGGQANMLLAGGGAPG